MFSTIQPDPATVRAHYIARAEALNDPARQITITLVPTNITPTTPHVPGFSLSMAQGTPIPELEASIRARLPPLEHPFAITTLGPEPRHLGAEAERLGCVADLKRELEEEVVEVRVRMWDPAREVALEREQREGLGSRLRRALGREGTGSEGEGESGGGGGS